MSRSVDPADFFLLLGSLIEERKLALKGGGRIAFAVVGAGGYTLDLEAAQPLRSGLQAGAETIVVCNQSGLAKLGGYAGAARTDETGAKPLFLWSGAEEPLLALAKALAGTRSVFAMRLAVMSGARR